MSFVEKKWAEGTVSFEDMIQQLHHIFAEDQVDVESVINVLSAYKSHPSDWKKFAIFDPYKYTRNLVDEGNGKFNLMLLCWGEGMGSSIHDHANAHCFVKVLGGELQETQFEWPENENEESEMKVKSVQTYSENQVTYINDSMGLHRMENPSHTDPAVTLHLYIPAYSKCFSFDQRTGHRQICRVTFFSKNGHKISHKSRRAITPAETIPIASKKKSEESVNTESLN